MESKFIAGGKPSAADKFVVNLYGRYCNANKFAGEIDLLEVLDAMKRQYPIDENRIVETGFSMGGAAAWQFAVHYQLENQTTPWLEAVEYYRGVFETIRIQKKAARGIRK